MDKVNYIRGIGGHSSGTLPSIGEIFCGNELSLETPQKTFDLRTLHISASAKIRKAVQASCG